MCIIKIQLNYFDVSNGKTSVAALSYIFIQWSLNFIIVIDLSQAQDNTFLSIVI